MCCEWPGQIECSGSGHVMEKIETKSSTLSKIVILTVNRTIFSPSIRSLYKLCFDVLLQAISTSQHSTDHSSGISTKGIILLKSRSTDSVPFSMIASLGTLNRFPEHSKDRNLPG